MVATAVRPSAAEAATGTAASTAATPTTTTRIMVRVGSVLVSVSPADAALMFALVQAVQVGASSVASDVAAGLAGYLTAHHSHGSEEDGEDEEEGDGAGSDSEGGDGSSIDDGSAPRHRPRGATSGSLAGMDDVSTTGDKADVSPASFDPDVADAAVAALALSLRTSGFGSAAGERMKQVAASMISAAAGQGWGGSGGSGNGSARPTYRSAGALLADPRGLGSAASSDASSYAGPALELRLLCDKLQVTLYNNVSAAVGGGTSSKGDSMEGGLPSYRSQVMRLTIAGIGARVNAGSVLLVGRLSGHYFNDNIVTWEPALEPWPFALSVTMRAQQKQAGKGGNAGSSRPRSTAAGASTSTLQVSLSGSGALNFTVSSAFLAALPTIQEAVQDMLTAGESPVTSSSAVATTQPGGGGGRSNATVLGSPGGGADGTGSVTGKQPQVQGGSPGGGSSLAEGSDAGGGANATSGSLAFAPFILINETGCALQIWRPEQGAILGRARIASPPQPAVVDSGQRLPISANFLALFDGEDEEGGDIPSSTQPTASSSSDAVASAAAAPTDDSDESSASSSASAVLDRAVPPPDADDAAEDDDVPPDFRMGVFQRGPTNSSEGDAASWLAAAAGGQPSGDVISGSVSVTVNLQVAGYRPLLRQPINRTGSTHVVLSPLDPSGATAFRGIPLLRAGAKAGDDEDAFLRGRLPSDDDVEDGGDDGETIPEAAHEDDEEEDEEDEYESDTEREEAERYGGIIQRVPSRRGSAKFGASSSTANGRKFASTDAANDPLAAWRDIVRGNASAGAVFPLQVELYVEQGVGGCKLVRMRSLVRIHNTTRIPVVIRALPGASAYFLRKVGAAAGLPPVDSESSEFPGALDKAATKLAIAMHNAAAEACTRAAAQRQATLARFRQQTSLSTAAEAADSTKQLFRSQSKVLMSAGIMQTDTSGLAGPSAMVEPPVDFEISCWDGAAGGLPLDRVILPGKSWRLPVPYASNSRVFIKPAIEVPALAPGLNQVSVAADGDDGRTVLRTPLETLIAEAQSGNNVAGGGGGFGLFDADADGSDNEGGDGSDTVRRPLHTVGSRTSTHTTAGNISFRSGTLDKDGGSTFQGSEGNCDEEEDDEDEDAYLDDEVGLYTADPRYDWSLFEGTEGTGAEKLAEQSGFTASSSSSSSGGGDGNQGLLSRLLRRETASTSEPDDHDRRPDDSAAAGLAVGIGLELLAHTSLMSILDKVMASQGAAQEESDSDDDEGGGSGDVSPAELRSHITSHVAVCPRSRDQGAGAAALAAVGGGASTNPGASTASLPSVGLTTTGSSGTVEALIQSHAFYYVASRVEMVPLARTDGAHSNPHHAHHHTRSSSSSAGGAVVQETSADREMEGLLRSAGALITLLIRAPVEVQNALPCEVQYEIGLPKALTSAGDADSVATTTSSTASARGAARAAAAAAAATPSTPAKAASSAAVPETPATEKKSRFGFLRRKTDVPATPAPASAPAVAPVPSGPSFAPAAASTIAPAAPSPASDVMLTIGSGALGPAQSLSLLYAHPDAPPMLGSLLPGAGGSANRSRARYKQRLAAARYCRGLSLRFRIPDSGYEWSPWVGLWSGHGSNAGQDRAAATALQSFAAGSIQVLPPLTLPFSQSSPLTRPLEMLDGAGEPTVLHTEHALSSAALMLAQAAAGGRDLDDPAGAGATAGGGDDEDDKEALARLLFGRKGRRSKHVRHVHTYTLSLSLYCRFWLCNASGLPLLYSTAVKTVGGSTSSKERATRGVKVAPGQAQPVLEEAFENQRFVMFRWGPNLLPTDRQPWSDRNGLCTSPRHPDTFVLPSPHWSWEGPWAVDMRGDVDSEGWQYAVDFPRGADGGWVGRRTPAHFVRRRRWVRTRLPPSSVALAARAAMTSSSSVLALTSSPFGLAGAYASGTNLSAAAGGRRRGSIGSLVDINDASQLDDVMAAGGVDDDSGLVPASATTLLSMGILLYGPDPACEDQCAVKVGDSAWSLPFPLANVGRPSLVVIKDRDNAGGSSGAGSDAAAPSPDGDTPSTTTSTASLRLPTTQHQYDLSVSVTPAFYGSDPSLLPLYRRTLSVTLSPRFLIANQLDAHLAAALHARQLATQGQAVGASVGVGAPFPSLLSPGGLLSTVGVYVLQVAQAGQHGEDGISLPHTSARAYLAGIAASGSLGGEAGYDVGAALHQRLLAAAELSSAPGRRQGAPPHMPAKGSTVPTVLSIPPGELAPFYWPRAPGTDGATDKVCLRVVRLVRKPAFNESAVRSRVGTGSASDLDADVSAGATRGRAGSVASVTGGGNALRSPQAGSSRTLVVPVTEWSGAFSIGQVNEIPLRLPATSSSGTRALGLHNSDVILRATISAHRARGTAMITVTSDSGLDPLEQVLASDETDLASAAEAALEEASGAGGYTFSSASGGGGGSSLLGEVQPLFWSTGSGEVSTGDLAQALARQLMLSLGPASSSKRSRALHHALAPMSMHHGAAAGLPPPPPLYRIDNHTLDSFVITQLGVGFGVADGSGGSGSSSCYRPPIHIPPRCSLVLAWDEPEIPFETVVKAAVAAATAAASASAAAAAAEEGGPSAASSSSTAVVTKRKPQLDFGALMKKMKDAGRLKTVAEEQDKDDGGDSEEEEGAGADKSAAASSSSEAQLAAAVKAAAAAATAQLVLGSHLRLRVRPTTVPVPVTTASASSAASTSGVMSTPPRNTAASSSSAAASSDVSAELDIDLNNVAQTCSLELAPGRALDEDSLGAEAGGSGATAAGLMSLLASPGANSNTISATIGGKVVARALTKKPLTYGTPVFLRSRHAAASWSIGRVYQSKATWAVTSAPDGSYAVSQSAAATGSTASSSASRGAITTYGSTRPLLQAGDPILAAQCQLDIDLASSTSTSASVRLGGSGGHSGSLADALAASMTSVPFVFENVSNAFGWTGLDAGRHGKGARHRAAAAAAAGMTSTGVDRLLQRLKSAPNLPSVGGPGVLDGGLLLGGGANSSSGRTVAVKYGDLVMVRHDALTSDGAAGAGGGSQLTDSTSSSFPDDGVSNDEDGEDYDVTASASQPLYLVCHRDGKVEWLQREVALSVARSIAPAPAASAPSGGRSGTSSLPRTSSVASARGPDVSHSSQPQIVACSVYLIVGGKPGSAVTLSKAEDSAGTATSSALDAVKGIGAGRRGIPSRITEEGGDSDSSGDESTKGGSGTPVGARRSGTSRFRDSKSSSSYPRHPPSSSSSSSAASAAARGTGFGLLPIAFLDRLVECQADDVSGSGSAAVVDVTAGGGAGRTIRQCRIPALSSLMPSESEGPASKSGGGGADGKSGGSDLLTTQPGGRVMSAMQRRRLAARGIKVDSDANAPVAAATAIPLPSTPIPADLRTSGGSGGGAGTSSSSSVPTLGSLLTAAHMGAGQSDHDDEEEADGDDVARKDGTAGASDGDDEEESDANANQQKDREGRQRAARKEAAAAAAAEAALATRLRQLRAAVLRLPMLQSLPASCAIVACGLTSQTLPKRVIAARVGFDGPTRVLTLQSHAVAPHGLMRLLSRSGSDRSITGGGKKEGGAASAATSSSSSSDAVVPQQKPLPAPSSRFDFEFDLALPSVAVSLVDSKPQELLLVSVDNLVTSVSVHHPYTTADLKIDDLQIDNQLPMAAHPVLLCRTPTTATSKPSGSDSGGAVVLLRPFFQGSIVHQAHRSSNHSATPGGAVAATPSSGAVAAAPGAPRGGTGSSSSGGGTSSGASIAHFPYASVLLQEMDIALEESLLRRLIGLVPPSLLAGASSSGGDGGLDITGGEDDPDFGVFGSGSDIVQRRARPGMLLQGNQMLSSRRGGRVRAFAPISALANSALNRLAASIVKAAAASSSASARGGRPDAAVRGLSHFVGTKKAVALQVRMREISRRARKAALRDYRKVNKARRKMTGVVKKGAEKTVTGLKTAAERTKREIAQLKAKTSQAQAAAAASAGGSGKFGGISGPSPEVLAAQQLVQRERSRRNGTGSSAALPSPSTGGGGPVGARLLGALESRAEYGWSSETVDTVTSLSSDVQWWWPARDPLASEGHGGGGGAGRSSALQLFLQHLVLHGIALNVTFTRDPLGSSGGSRQGGGEGGGSSSNSGSSGGGNWLTSPLLATLNALGAMTLSLNRAPIRLNGLEVVNVLAGPHDLAARVAQHYVSAGLAEVYKVVLSADVLGNPVGVVSALGSGVRDFFVEPASARSPLEFSRALGKGSVSLLTNTVIGLGVGVSSLAASMGRGVSALAFDEDWVRGRAERAARAAASGGATGGAITGRAVANSLLEGTRELGRGIAQGLAGVVLDPLRGAEAEGAAGFVKGVGRGLAGLVAKPVAGVLDLAARQPRL